MNTKAKVYYVLDKVFMNISLFMLGMGLALVFYDRHLCCDKGNDALIYLLIGLVCDLASLLFNKLYYVEFNKLLDECFKDEEEEEEVEKDE